MLWPMDATRSRLAKPKNTKKSAKAKIAMCVNPKYTVITPGRNVLNCIRTWTEQHSKILFHLIVIESDF